MFKYQALFLILLVTSSLATSLFKKYPINYSSKRNLFAVLSEIKTKIQSGGAMNAVIKLLDDITSEVQNEQTNHDAVAAQEQAQCQSEVDFRNKEISDATDALNSANSQLTSCQASLTRAQNDLSNNVLSQQDLNDQKAQIDLIRSQDNALYLERVQDHQDAVQAIDVALELLDEIFSGEESFVQLSTLSAKMLKHSIKLRATRHYSPVVSVFAQIAAKKVLADSASLEKVRDLLQSLRTNVEDSLADYQSQETTSKETYESRVGDIQTSLADLADIEASLRDQITTLENCVASQSAISSTASSKLKRNSDLLEQATNMCSNFVAEYNDNTAKRYIYFQSLYVYLYSN